MAAPMSEATRYPHSGTGSTDHAQTVSAGRLIDLEILNAGADPCGWASIVGVRVVEKGNVLQVVCPQCQRSLACRSSEDVVARILDRESNVFFLSELDPSGHCAWVGDVDRVRSQIPKSAGSFGGQKWTLIKIIYQGQYHGLGIFFVPV